jgi:hypothetical protein
MYDQLFDGRRLWVLTLVNNFSRQDYNDVRLHSAIGERTPMIMFSAHRNTPMGSTVPEVLV